MEIQLGSKVRDIYSGFEGFVLCRTVWVNGCVRVGVQPVGTDEKTGGPKEIHSIDEGQLEVLAAGPSDTPKETGGGKEPGRRKDPL